MENLEYDDCKWFLPDFKEAKCIKVYDGDTMTVGLHFLNKAHKFNLRLVGIDTPELRGAKANVAAAQKARDYVREKCLNKIVQVKLLGKDKYGRLLASVYSDSVCINEQLLKEKLAVPYMANKNATYFRLP
jgi:micrococcal nuclease